MEIRTQAHLPTLRQLLLYRQAELRAEVHAAQQARQAAPMQGSEVRDLKDNAELTQRQRTEDFLSVPMAGRARAVLRGRERQKKDTLERVSRGCRRASPSSMGLRAGA